MQRCLLVAALLFASALAGCAGQEAGPELPAFDPGTLSQPIHAVKAPEEVWVPATSDGKRMNAVVYRPETTERVPVFINFSPYWGDTAMSGGDAFGKYMIHEYVPRGYAVVLSAVRGTGHSEGCFQIGGDLELKDTRDVIDWFAAQTWSNGKVAAGGKSYDSTTQNGVIAKFPTPNLKGIFHVSGITDMYRYNAKAGVIYRNGLTFNHAYWQQGLHEYGIHPPALPPGMPPTPPSPVDPSEIYGGGDPEGASSHDDEDAASLARLADDVACPEMVSVERDGLATAASGLRTDYWKEREWTASLPGSTWNGSVFFVHGLQDWNVKPDDIDPWVEILQAKGTPILGWLHQETYNLGHVYPMRQDWNETMLRWLDATLKGKETRMGDLWGFDVQGSDMVWRHNRQWPPPALEELVLGAAGGGQAASHRVAGTPWANVTVVPQGADDIARVVLYDRAPDGNRVFVDEAVRRLALADDFAEPRAYQPGQAITLNLTFFPMDHEILSGHTWGVELGAPVREAKAEGESTPPNFFFTADQVAGVEYRGVEVHLPVVDAGGNLSPQPAGMACFAC